MIAKNRERPEILDQILMDFSHRTTKKMPFLLGERYHLHTYLHVNEVFSILFENLMYMRRKTR